MKKISEALEEYGFIVDGDEAYVLHRDIVQAACAELAQLKERLRGIDKIRTYDAFGERVIICPVCEYEIGHGPDCWLKAWIGGE